MAAFQGHLTSKQLDLEFGHRAAVASIVKNSGLCGSSGPVGYDGGYLRGKLPCFSSLQHGWASLHSTQRAC